MLLESGFSVGSNSAFKFQPNKNADLKKYESALKKIGIKYGPLSDISNIATYDLRNRGESIFLYIDDEDGVIDSISFGGMQGHEFEGLEEVFGISFDNMDEVLSEGIIRMFIHGEGNILSLGIEYLKGSLNSKLKTIVEEYILAVEYNKYSKNKKYIIDKHIQLNKINAKEFTVADEAIRFL